MPNVTEKGELPVEELSKEDQISKLKLKCKTLEKVAAKAKKDVPQVLQVGRPIHLNIIQNNFIYQMIIPEHALCNIDQFSNVHAVISKFGVTLSQMEDNAKAQMEASKAAPVEDSK